MTMRIGNSALEKNGGKKRTKKTLGLLVPYRRGPEERGG
jgi:hypothetical protein